MHAQHLLKCHQGPRQVATLQENESHTRQRAKMSRFQGQRLLDVPDRLVKAVHQVVRGGAFVPAFRKVGRHLDYAVELLDRRREVAGGHRLSAGARFTEPVEEAVQKVLDACEQAYKDQGLL